jgi:hypothetical protein
MKIRVNKIFMMRLALLICLATVSPASRALPLWGDLKPGSYAVGFRTLFVRDLARPALGSEKGAAAGQGRQMQIGVWYPAARALRSARMRWAEYAHLLAQELDFAPLDAARREQGRLKFIEATVELGGNADELRAKLPALLALETGVVRDAPPAPGRFPLVVFPDSPAKHSILCEYLASHGFVVAATSLKGTHEAELDVAVTGIETIAADLQFVINQVRTLPPVDREKLALIGLGIGASGCLALQMRNAEVDAYVSLEGGILSEFEDRLLKRTPYYDLAAVRVPVLAIHAPHASINPAFLDQYKYATRYAVHFPQMSEFYFLNYGEFERLVPGIIGKAPGDTKAGFEWAARYVLNFLQAHLKHDTNGLTFLDNRVQANSVPPELMTVRKLVGLPPPPNLAELKAMIRRDGIQSVVALYRQLRATDPQPFTQEKFVELFNWLAWRRDPEWQVRREWSLLRVDSFPNSARAHFTLAGVAVQIKDNELARKHFAEALRLLPNDKDPALDEATRSRLERGAKEGLRRLGE